MLKIIGHCVETPPFLTVLELCPEVSCFIMVNTIMHTQFLISFLFWCYLRLGFHMEENYCYQFRLRAIFSGDLDHCSPPQVFLLCLFWNRTSEEYCFFFGGGS